MKEQQAAELHHAAHKKEAEKEKNEIQLKNGKKNKVKINIYEKTC